MLHEKRIYHNPIDCKETRIMKRILIISSILLFQFLNYSWGIDSNNTQKIPNTNVEYLQYKSESPNPKGVILWVHGGPFRDPIQQTLSNKEKFFTHFTNTGYHLIAPIINNQNGSEKNKEYKNILNTMATWIQDMFPAQDMVLISHSLGAHWSGHTLVDPQSSLRQACSKWIILGGAVMHAPGFMRQWMTSLDDHVTHIHKCLDSTGQLQPDNNDIFYESEKNNIINHHLDAFARFFLSMTPDLQSFELGFNVTENFLLNPEKEQELSIYYHTKRLPENVPILIVTTLQDRAVTVDESLAFHKKLVREGRNDAYFLTNADGAHSWMADEFYPDTYSSSPQLKDKAQSSDAMPLFLSHKILGFLEGQTDLSSDQKSSIKETEDYLAQNPSKNYWSIYQNFIQNKSIEFISFKNDSYNSPFPTEQVVQLQGINKVQEDCRILNKWNNEWESYLHSA